jgi:hypothetical protein
MRQGAAAVCPLARMRGRGEREGARGVLRREKGGGVWGGRGTTVTGSTLLNGVAGGGGRGRGAGGGRWPRGGEELGMGVQDRRSGRAARGGRNWPGADVRGWAARPNAKQRQRGGCQGGIRAQSRAAAVKFDLKSNSNHFKTDSNHSNFDRLKNGLLGSKN